MKIKPELHFLDFKYKMIPVLGFAEEYYYKVTFRLEGRQHSFVYRGNNPMTMNEFFKQLAVVTKCRNILKLCSRYQVTASKTWFAKGGNKFTNLKEDVVCTYQTNSVLGSKIRNFFSE